LIVEVCVCVIVHDNAFPLSPPTGVYFSVEVMSKVPDLGVIASFLVFKITESNFQTNVGTGYEFVTSQVHVYSVPAIKSVGPSKIGPVGMTV